MNNPPAIRLSLCFVACKDDEDWLKKDAVIKGRRRENQDFAVEPWIDSEALSTEGIRLGEVRSLFHSDGKNASDLLDTKKQALSEFVGQRHCVFIVFDGDDPNVSWRLCKQEIDERCRRFRIPLVIIPLRNREYHWKPMSDTVHYIFNDGRAILAGRGNHAAALSNAHTAFVRKLSDIYEEQHEAPQVGYGVLLVSQEGKFMLSKRLRDPGRGKYATFGARMPKVTKHTKQTSIAEALLECAKNQLKLPKPARLLIKSGPLLSCTSIVLENTHLIDLTFLALAKSEFQIDFKGLGKGRYEPLRKSKDKDWFTFKEMVGFYERGLLFAPVANAFEQFCICCSVSGLTFGSSSFGLLPNGKSFDLDEGFNLVVAGIPSAKIKVPNTALLASYLHSCFKLKAKSPFFFEE